MNGRESNFTGKCRAHCKNGLAFSSIPFPRSLHLLSASGFFFCAVGVFTNGFVFVFFVTV